MEFFLPCRVWWEGAGVRAVSMVFGGSLAEKGDLWSRRGIPMSALIGPHFPLNSDRQWREVVIIRERLRSWPCPLAMHEDRAPVQGNQPKGRWDRYPGVGDQVRDAVCVGGKAGLPGDPSPSASASSRSHRLRSGRAP